MNLHEQILPRRPLAPVNHLPGKMLVVLYRGSEPALFHQVDLIAIPASRNRPLPVPHSAGW